MFENFFWEKAMHDVTNAKREKKYLWPVVNTEYVTVSGKTRLKSEIQLASNNAKHATMGKIHANAVFRQIMSRNMYYIDFYIYFAALCVLCVIFVL